jgi:hypothetical protein
MEVYLVPVGGDRYELYCETPHAGDAAGSTPPAGLFRRAAERFRVVLDLVERERHRPPPDPDTAEGRLARAGRRARRRMTCWLAERIADQRVLWHLRSATDAVLLFPADLEPGDAVRRLRVKLDRDRRRHGRWLIVNGLGLVGSGLLMPIPGPNLVAYYFVFRVVGHYLSRRGAQHGLEGVRWQLRPSDPLVELRTAIRLAPRERDQHVHEIAARLQLEHLAAFFERIVLPTA